MRGYSTRRISWAALGVVGYMLSPLSWWNDLYVNLPISVLAAHLGYAIMPSLFFPVMIGTYWFTNILGLLLMHAGAVGLGGRERVKFDLKSAFKWFALSLLYTVVVVILYRSGVIRPFEAYFSRPG